MIAFDLLNPDVVVSDASPPLVDPLTEIDALQEAQLMDVCICAVRANVGLLFEMRMALQLRETNSGVMIGQGVRDVAWKAKPRSSTRTAWNVISSRIEESSEGYVVDLSFMPSAHLRVVAAGLRFYSCEMPGIGSIPPDYELDDSVTIDAELASWLSPVDVMHMTSLSQAS